MKRTGRDLDHGQAFKKLRTAFEDEEACKKRLQEAQDDLNEAEKVSKDARFVIFWNYAAARGHVEAAQSCLEKLRALTKTATKTRGDVAPEELPKQDCESCLQQTAGALDDGLPIRELRKLVLEYSGGPVNLIPGPGATMLAEYRSSRLHGTCTFIRKTTANGFGFMLFGHKVTMDSTS